MLLIITNSRDATADYLSSRLQEDGVPLLRLDTDNLVSHLSVAYRPSHPSIRAGERWFEPSDFLNVWYRRPERLKSDAFEGSAEGQYTLDEWAEALEGFFAHIPLSRWMNHPSVNAVASHKLEQLTKAQRFGLQIPNTLVTQDPHAVLDFFKDNADRLIIKPMAGGYIERDGEDNDSLIYTNQVRRQDLDDLSDIPAAPTLLQQFIEKQSDVRITIVDGDIHAVELTAKDPDGRQRCDVRRNNMMDVTYRQIDLPVEVEAKLRMLIEAYGLRFAAVDMVVSRGGVWYFLEINPNGQWAWLDLTAGTTIASSFSKAFSHG